MVSAHDSWGQRAEARLDAVRAAGQWREVRELDGAGPTFTLPDGRPVVSFASNDYLGLAGHPAPAAAAREAIDRWGTGAGSARLVVGARPVHRELEAALAEWKHTERAVLFPTGFAANLGALAAVAGPGTLLCSDELNHASIIDGCRLSRAEVAVYPHRDLDHLDRLLTRDRRPKVVVTDTVFSMDGDAADLDAMAELCARRGVLLVLDEAHAVLGPALDPADHPDLALLRVGTLSKTLGSLGGFVATSTPFADLLVNTARPYIFTTASTPADAAAALASLGVLRSAEGEALVARLRTLVDRIAPGHPSPIVPIVLGDEDRAVKAADALLDRGLLVPAIRPPTVAPGTSRLRVTLSAAHTDEQVDSFVAALDDLGIDPCG
jgi:8-amino-7-oxononanoate synthase